MFKKTSFKFFILITFFSFLFSSLFFITKLDQDFFSFLYVGRGMNEGGILYKELGDNKGPVLYLLYLFLYKLGGINYYRIPLVLFSGIIDGVSFFFLIWAFFKIFKTKVKFGFVNLFFILLLVGIYKSFAIGEYMGAIYSETLGMLFVSASIYLAVNRRNFWSGLVFAFAPFTRLTLLFYFIFLFSIVFEYFLNFKFNFIKNFKKFVIFCLGMLTSVLLIISYLVKNSIFDDFLYYNFILNFKYANYVNKSGRLLYVLYTSIYEFRILILVLLFLFLLTILFFDKRFKQKSNVFFLLISCFLATFFGGIFYYHHFIQFVPVIFFVLVYFFYIKRMNQKVLLYLFSALLFASYSFSIFTRDGFEDLTQLTAQISRENTNYKYWQIVPYYPEYYISNSRYSPDKYFITFFISRYFSSNPKEDINNHLSIPEERICNTLFLFVNQNKFDYLVSEDYLNSFKDRFKLVQSRSYVQGDTTLNIYEPNCKNN